jgi:DNA-binding HxlR family transcriptional regulator
VRDYGQYCPIARGAEVFAERWTPIILRNILLGCRTFNEISAGAPGLSRALLTRRLRELQRAGILEISPKPDGHGSVYAPTPAGAELQPVLAALGLWADRWTDVRPEHSSPGMVLWSWSQIYLRKENLPDHRVVARFDYTYRGRRLTSWLLVERGDAEVCAFDPGYGDDLVVTISDPVVFARWHLGLIEWTTALRSGGLDITGAPELRHALPTWNGAPAVFAGRRAGIGLLAAAASAQIDAPA